MTKTLLKISLIDDLWKRLLRLEFKSNHSIKTKCLKWIVKKYCHIIKMTSQKIRKMTISPKQKMKHTCCVSCKKYIGNSDMSSRTIKNKVNLLKSKCLKCKNDKSMFLKQIK